MLATNMNGIDEMTQITINVPPLFQPRSYILLSEYEKLKKTIEDNEKTIRELNSNADLLREEKRKNDIIIKELENTNNQYKEKINELHKVIEHLSKKDIMRDNKILFEKYVMAIQDYNSCYSLENKINVNAKKQLKRLKRNRNGQCHYFDKDDDDPNEMFYVLNEKIKSIPQHIKDLFDTEYPDVLDGLKELLNDSTMHQLRKPSNDELKYINKWWDI
jgi:predicted nucleotidyltransferase